MRLVVSQRLHGDYFLLKRCGRRLAGDSISWVLKNGNSVQSRCALGIPRKPPMTASGSMKQLKTRKRKGASPAAGWIFVLWKYNFSAATAVAGGRLTPASQQKPSFRR